MGGYRHTGVGNAVAKTDYASAGDVQLQSLIWCGTSGGSASAYTATPSPAWTSYAAGGMVAFRANHTNTGAATLNVNALGAKNLYGAGGNNLGADELLANDLAFAVYNGTAFQMIAPLVRGTTDEITVTNNGAAWVVSLPQDVTIARDLTVTDDLFVLDNAVVTGYVSVDTILEKTAAAGITIDSVLLKDGAVSCSSASIATVTTSTALVTDTISERTSAAGVTIDGLVVKDAGLTVASGNIILNPVGALVTQIGGVSQTALVDGFFRGATDNDMALGHPNYAWNSVYTYGVQSIGSTSLTLLAPANKDVILQSNGTGTPSTLTFGWTGRLNFAPNSAFGTSSKTVGTDAPADWLEIQIAGVVGYIPVYAA
jgi:hypothetical protein